MFKKRISYVDFDGVDRQEDFYFHLSPPEVIRMEAKLGGVSIENYSRTLVDHQNSEKMITFIEDIVLTSYGRKSENGKSFMKGPAVREEFEYSQAYAELLVELLTNPESAEKFAAGVAIQTKDHKKSQVEQV